MRPLARLHTELLITGIGGVVVGIVALLGALSRGVEPAQAVLPFSALAVLFALIQRSSGLKWIVTNVAAAPDFPAQATREADRATWQRTGMTLVLWSLLVGMALAFSPGIAAPMGGLIFGVAAIDIRSATTVARSARNGREIWRETGSSWLASGRRPLFGAPRD